MNFFKSLFNPAPVDYENLYANDFLKQMKATENFILLDVRTNVEFNEKKINGARNLDIFNSSFTTELNKLDKNKAYFVYCRSGNRSAQACKIMAKQGFHKLYNLAGGILSI